MPLVKLLLSLAKRYATGKRKMGTWIELKLAWFWFGTCQYGRK
jgi:hypothetical protein